MGTRFKNPIRNFIRAFLCFAPMLALAGPPPEQCVALGPIPLVEYFNPSLNHYFYTHPCSIGELAYVDAGGAGQDWKRTGWVLQVYAVATAGPVQRFYGSVSPGPNSHVYTAGEEAQTLLRLAQSTPATQPRWNPESPGNFSTYLRAADGRCFASNTAPGLRRFYNNGFENGLDPNHRFVAETATDVIAQMKAQGWKDEGEVFCVGGAWLDGVAR